MMRSLWALAALIGVVAPALAQPQVPIPWANKLFLPDILNNPTQPPPPVITHNFGAVPKGTLCVHKMTLTNIYDVPLQVLDIVKSCGCMEAYAPQRVLQPNESAEFVISMDTRTLTGPTTKTVKVTVGPQFVSTAVFHFTVDSRPDVTLSPGAIAFGTVAQGQKASQAVTLESQGIRSTWKLTGVVPGSSVVDVQVREGSRGFVGTKYVVTATLKPDTPAGPIAETISLKTNDPAAPIIQIPITGMVQAPVTLSPDVVRFEQVVKVGEVAEHRVLVRGTTQSFKLRPLDTDADGVSVISTLRAPGPNQVIFVRYAPMKATELRKTIQLTLDMADGTTAKSQLIIEAKSELPTAKDKN